MPKSVVETIWDIVIVVLDVIMIEKMVTGSTGNVKSFMQGQCCHQHSHAPDLAQTVVQKPVCTIRSTELQALNLHMRHIFA